MSKLPQISLKDFEAEMTGVKNGLAQVEKERKDRDRGDNSGDKDKKVQNTKSVNKNYSKKAVSIIEGLSAEELKIVCEDLKKSSMEKFHKMGEAEVKFEAVSFYDEKNRTLRYNERIGTEEAYSMIDQISVKAHEELAKKLGQGVEHQNLLKAEFNEHKAHNELSARLAMADKLIKGGMKQERAERLCRLSNNDAGNNPEENKGYREKYNDSSEALIKAMNNYEVADKANHLQQNPHISAFHNTELSHEGLAKMRSELIIRQNCIKYCESALGTGDKKQQEERVALSNIAEALKQHPDCAEYKTGHSEALAVRKKVAKIILNQSTNDSKSLRGLSWIKDAITSAKVALHLGSKASRDAVLVAKDIVAGLRKNSTSSAPNIAPSTSKTSHVKNNAPHPSAGI